MTDSTAPSDPREALSYLQVWANSLSQALGDIARVPFACVLQTEAPPGASQVNPDDLWIVVGSAGALRGEMSLRLSPATIVRLAQILMGEPAVHAEVTSERREAALELLRQVSGLAATELRTHRGEIPLQLESSTGAPSWPPSFSGWFLIGEDASRILLEVHLSAAMLASLRAEQSQTDVASAMAKPMPLGPYDAKVNLDLLMDVELKVILRFGGRRMLLRELLDLNPGSVITLDRQVQDPVDMLLDGRVVARGEVVVSEGNYALRVTEIGPAGG